MAESAGGLRSNALCETGEPTVVGRSGAMRQLRLSARIAEGRGVCGLVSCGDLDGDVAVDQGLAGEAAAGVLGENLLLAVREVGQLVVALYHLVR